MGQHRLHEIARRLLQGMPHALPILRIDLRHHVFDKGALGGPAGWLAFVVSACGDDREQLQAEVMLQAQPLGLGPLRVQQTVVEKRATFACTPQLQRPPSHMGNGLWAVADFVAGPYPATLEGAVRCGLAAGARSD